MDNLRNIVAMKTSSLHTTLVRFFSRRPLRA